MTDINIEMLKEMKKNGMSYIEIRDKTGLCMATIAKYCKGITSQKEGCINRSNKHIPISEDTREKLRNAAKLRIMNTKKIWTSPEKRMFYSLLERGYIVRFNDIIEKNSETFFNEEYDFIFQAEIQRYCVDFLDVKNRTCYEINGNYWHANPKMYDTELLTECQKFNIQRDENKKKYLESKGYKVEIIWEDEIENINLPPKDIEHSERYLQYIQKCIKYLSTIKTKTKKIAKKETPMCIDCGHEVKWKHASRCSKCNEKYCKTISEKNMKFVVSKEELINDLNTMSIMAIGRKYGVSDNTIRKRCMRLNIDYKTGGSYNG